MTLTGNLSNPDHLILTILFHLNVPQKDTQTTVNERPYRLVSIVLACAAFGRLQRPKDPPCENCSHSSRTTITHALTNSSFGQRQRPRPQTPARPISQLLLFSGHSSSSHINTIDIDDIDLAIGRILVVDDPD